MFYLYSINTDYKGVYQIEYFIPCITILGIIFIFWILSKQALTKIKKIILLLTLILIPLIIYFTLPNYIYNDGKEIIRKELKSSSLEFPKFQEEYTVPITNNTKSFFIKDKEYYYIITLGNENKYFRLDPVTGSLNELSSKFW